MGHSAAGGEHRWVPVWAPQGPADDFPISSRGTRRPEAGAPAPPTFVTAGALWGDGREH